MAIVNLWDPKPSEHSKTVGPGAKKQRAARPVWSVDIQFEGKTIKDFPLTYIVKHNNPWIYFEVLKTLSPPIMDPAMTAQQATTGTATEGSLIARFTNAVNEAIDKVLVPQDPQYANAKIIFTTLAAKLRHVAHKGADGAPDEGDGDNEGGDPDFMKVVAQNHPDVMSRAPRGSPAWNAIRGRLLQEFNQGGLIAEKDGTASTLQQRNIEARGGPIRSVILNALRAQGLLG